MAADMTAMLLIGQMSYFSLASRPTDDNANYIE